MEETIKVEAPPQRNRRYIKLQLKLAIVFTLLFSVAFAVIFIWFYNYAAGVAKTRLGESLQYDLEAGIARIDGDEFMALYNEAEPTLYDDRGDADPDNDVYYTDDPRYWEIAEWLHTIRVVDPNAQPWTFVRHDLETDPNGFSYVVDGLALDEPLPSNVVSFKETDEAIDGKLFTGLEGVKVYLDDMYEWEGSSYISGYAPITDAQGNVVAGLGIDYRAQYIHDVENEVLRLAIPAFLITYLIMFGLIYAVSRIISRPIVKLTQIAGKIGEGDYEQDFSETARRFFPDEIDTLGDVFQIMIGKVAKREEKLKQQVADLQIQIDHSKRDEQVKEIVDNDFFQTLQSKAYEMRSRRQQPTEE
jgi:hypothetical protein